MVLIPIPGIWFRRHYEGIENIPKEGPALIACNHISYLDYIAQGSFVEKAGRRPRFFAKAELYKNPIFRTVLTGAGQIPVERGSGDAGPVENGTKALKAGELVMVYPEATITKNPDWSPMKGKTGIARLTLATGVPVIPLAVWGAQHVWQRDGIKSLKFGRPVWVKAGAPLDFSDREDRANDPATFREVTDAVMAQLSLLVDDMRARYPKQWS